MLELHRQMLNPNFENITPKNETGYIAKNHALPLLTAPLKLH